MNMIVASGQLVRWHHIHPKLFRLLGTKTYRKIDQCFVGPVQICLQEPLHVTLVDDPV